MFYLACDVSGQFVDAVLVTRSLTVRQRYHVPNTPAALRALITPLTETYRFTVGVESTGMHHRHVVALCDELAIDCRLINPILTKEVLTHSIRGRKTDRDDAVVIAKLLVQGEGRLVTRADVENSAKALARSACRLRRQQVSLTLHRRHLGDCGVTEPAVFAQLDQQLGEAVQAVRSEAQALVHDAPEWHLLQSLPGIAEWLATVLAVELGLPYCLRSGDALVALAGLDGRVRQSGPRLSSGRLTKRGSPYLRWALVCAAMVARIHDPELKSFYDAKRAAGKPYRVALCATAKKLAYRVHAVLARGTPYVSVEK